MRSMRRRKGKKEEGEEEEEDEEYEEEEEEEKEEGEGELHTVAHSNRDAKQHCLVACRPSSKPMAPRVAPLALPLDESEAAAGCSPCMSPPKASAVASGTKDFVGEKGTNCPPKYTFWSSSSGTSKSMDESLARALSGRTAARHTYGEARANSQWERARA